MPFNGRGCFTRFANDVRNGEWSIGVAATAAEHEEQGNGYKSNKAHKQKRRPPYCALLVAA